MFDFAPGTTSLVLGCLCCRDNTQSLIASEVSIITTFVSIKQMKCGAFFDFNGHQTDKNIRGWPMKSKNCGDNSFTQLMIKNWMRKESVCPP